MGCELEFHIAYSAASDARESRFRAKKTLASLAHDSEQHELDLVSPLIRSFVAAQSNGYGRNLEPPLDMELTP